MTKSSHTQLYHPTPDILVLRSLDSSTRNVHPKFADEQDYMMTPSLVGLDYTLSPYSEPTSI
jgi:hypothetical protein